MNKPKPCFMAAQSGHKYTNIYKTTMEGKSALKGVEVDPSRVGLRKLNRILRCGKCLPNQIVLKY